MRIPSTLRTIVPLVAVMALAACGGGDDSSDAVDGGDGAVETADVASGAESIAPPTAPPSDDAVAVATTLVEGGVEIDEVPADPGADLADPTATVTQGAETYEAEGFAQVFDMESGGYIDLDGDFLICEAVNPAFEGDANIIVKLDDDLEFTFRVNDGEPYVELGADFSGDETNDVSFERDGLTITGSANFDGAEPVSFDITCG
ncbi:hypothetical protein BDK89_4181 [Ilumatobacter fluminis]|uniref:Lipoprotein antigen n=1 Tax=Ilumatobacter fluminis TaxID=467091 RepID=A0A4R7I4E9_9ACTN|nr:hypothetical protein [Ilumatobacter fluminis]TDT18557.1 hypothetical protein BDK89_4181 [Ilumatobacter fluminis]